LPVTSGSVERVSGYGSGYNASTTKIYVV